MLVGRFVPIVLVLALAGSLARQQPVPADQGTLPTHRPLFVGLLVGVVIIVAGLTFFPASPSDRSRKGCHDVPTTRADAAIVRAACSTRGMLLTSLPDAVRKLDPRVMVRNPVMFVVEIGAVFATVWRSRDPSVFAWSVVVWLWLTVVFANLAEAVAEGRGKAQAETLATRQDRDHRPTLGSTDGTRGGGVRRRS